MNIQVRFECIVRDIFRIRARGGRWQRHQNVRETLQAVWKNTDILAPELCDVLNCSMEELEDVLDESRNRDPREPVKDCWEANIEASLPLFIPIKITGI
jgi:hypothetical protein